MHEWRHETASQNSKAATLVPPTPRGAFSPRLKVFYLLGIDKVSIDALNKTQIKTIPELVRFFERSTPEQIQALRTVDTVRILLALQVLVPEIVEKADLTSLRLEAALIEKFIQLKLSLKMRTVSDLRGLLTAIAEPMEGVELAKKFETVFTREEREKLVGLIVRLTPQRSDVRLLRILGVQPTLVSKLTKQSQRVTVAQLEPFASLLAERRPALVPRPLQRWQGLE